MSDDNLSPKQMVIALVVLGAMVAGAIYWVSSTRLGPAPSEPPFRSEAQRAQDAKLAAEAAQHTADIAQVRSKLAGAPNARRVSEIIGVLGPAMCSYRGFRNDPNPHFYVAFHDAPTVTAPVPAACTEKIGWGDAKFNEPFNCTKHPQIMACDARVALLDPSNH